MEPWIRSRIDALLLYFGCSAEQIAGTDQWVLLGIILLIGGIVDLIVRVVLLSVVRRIVLRTKADWDDIIFSPRVLRRLSHIVMPVLIYVLLPVAFSDGGRWVQLILKLDCIYVIVAVLRFVNALLKALFSLADRSPDWQGKPLKGLMQTGQVLAILISAILILALLLERSPAMLLTGLGASAAVMMLIFKDSILGLVSGVQLSANNMLNVGDWITMPKYGVDGNVEEVTLTTVKIRNWDQTVVTIPPYLLVSDSVQNWQAMRQAGGRRIKRSVNIDLLTIRFCDEAMLASLRDVELAAPCIDAMLAESGGAPVTNIGLFRRYVTAYLRSRADLNPDMSLLVRQLQPTDMGLPIELYCFTRAVDWVPYEETQADIFDHVLAMVPAFGLRVYQRQAAGIPRREELQQPS